MYVKQCECTWCTYIFNMYVYYSEFWSNQKNKRKTIYKSWEVFTSCNPDVCHTDDLWVLPWCRFVPGSYKSDTRNPNDFQKTWTQDGQRWNVIPNPRLFGHDTSIRINCIWCMTNSWGSGSNPWCHLHCPSHLCCDPVSSVL